MRTERSLPLFLALALLGLLFLSLAVPTARAANPVIVRVATTGTTMWPCGDQSNWSNPCALQTALSNTVSGAELWVAAGTYTPTLGVTRTVTFQLRDGIALYGGFAGTETLRNQRNFTANLTILSGDIGTPGDANDNAYHVVTGIGVTNTAVLDGFTVAGGNANGNTNADPNSRGGGIYLDGSSPVLTNVIINGNLAGGPFSSGYGGGIFNYGGSPMLSNVTFISNSTSVWGYGGGMYGEHFGSPTLTNVTFNGNSALWGGGMCNDYISPTLTNLIFHGNHGSGMYNNGSNPTLTNVTFSRNAGGGMSNDTSSPLLTNVTFISNTSSADGGGMSNRSDSSPALMNVTFISNTAWSGGGMYNEGSNPTLTGVTFVGNWATNDGSRGTWGAGGGGMYNYNARPTLTDVTFSGNSTVFQGGGMFNTYGSRPALTNVIFSRNSAYVGGGMYNAGGTPMLTNVTFSLNGAWGYDKGGGAMYNAQSYPTLTNVTLAGNSAAWQGGGIYNESSTPTIRNSILWGNTAANGTQIYDLSSTPSLSYSVVQNGYAGGTHIITADPRLGLLGDWGGAMQTVPLLPGSSAIDAGDDAQCPATDQRGEPRPVGPHCDIGAFEGQLTTVNLPLISR